jgi:ABC-type transport system involved in cytochrome bd biosynthesis fused ATPase/permease subunit
VIAQQTFIFSATIRANLRLARQDAEDRDLLQALERAELGEWFARQNAGLDTWLGGQGGQLSGGERQRFAIARAILRDAKLWCLDEPTAHLDADTEGRVLEILLEASRGRMMLWSTHRLTKMEKMDEILVLQAGKIIERGSHFDLLNTGGYYSRLFWLQKNILSE